VLICGQIKNINGAKIILIGGGYCKSAIDIIEQEEMLVNVPSGVISTDLHK